MSGKNPAFPPPRLDARDGEVRELTDVLWRLHRTAGAYGTRWNQPRAFGPLEQMRWEPMPAPAGEHPSHAVLYAATDWRVCVAEVYQVTRSVSLSEGGPCLSAWEPTRPLRLLDLSSAWPVRHGATASLHADRREVCRRWAAGIESVVDPSTGERLDGLVAPSTMLGLGECVVLFAHGLDSLPTAPAFSQLLVSPEAHAMLTQVFAPATGWPLTP